MGRSCIAAALLILSSAVAAVIAREPAQSAVEARPRVPLPEIVEPDDVLWLFFVDDLHIPFTNTGRLRDTLRIMAAGLIHDGDWFSARASGPSPLSIDATSGRFWLEDAVRWVTGNGLRVEHIAASPPDPNQPSEEEHRALRALKAATAMLTGLDRGRFQRTVLVYVSDGFDLSRGRDTRISDQLSVLTRAAVGAGVRIFAVRSRGALALDLDAAVDRDALSAYIAASERSLRAIAEPTGGFVLWDYTERDAAFRSIRTEVMR